MSRQSICEKCGQANDSVSMACGKPWFYDRICKRCRQAEDDQDWIQDEIIEEMAGCQSRINDWPEEE